ncbi:hypothetical protein DM860_000130 [Cuscuta australis]|uniref:UDP-glycosyltransferases domain-containing protein n=1 Tax=Cuscuta australis TaxID=267555 RepID=A0A328CWJ5_9ASTE|nr:hypothetical protein DM860_000130 [Cuscuta australis]
MEVFMDNNGKHHRRKIAAVIEAVVQGEGGKGVRENAAAMREMLAEKGDKEIDNVAEELRKLCAKNLCRSESLKKPSMSNPRSQQPPMDTRFPKGADHDDIKHVLPDGFLERVRDRGLVVIGVAPQAKILEHPRIGGFVSHCEWSSVMEGMKYGVPIISMPMQIDQPVNAKLAAEVGVAMEVVMDSSGKHHRRKIASVIEAVVQGEGGKGVRENAAAMREMLAEKGDKEIDNVAEELRKICAKNLCRSEGLKKPSMSNPRSQQPPMDTRWCSLFRS